jgi:two-component system response regulator LytT
MHTNKSTVLIVEDELLISSLLERQLGYHGYRVVGNAISYDLAVELFHQEQPDIILIDILLSGRQTGIDFAAYLRSLPACPPFVFLTAQLDRGYLEEAKKTLPAGYLNKPIQIDSLLSTMEVALYRQGRLGAGGQEVMVCLRDRGVNHFVHPADILYLHIDHIYVNTYLCDGRKLVDRRTLTDFLDHLGRPEIVQTHRSYAVNLAKVISYGDQGTHPGEHPHPGEPTP